MAIRDWHPGKLGIWWGGLLLWVLLVQPNLDDWWDDVVQGWVGLAWFVMTIWAFVATWKWFSAREKRPPSE